MKNKLKKIALLLTATLAMAVFSAAIYPCPELQPGDPTVLLPNPDDCATFYMCEDGVPVLYRCPNGLHFDPTLGVCEFPQNIEGECGDEEGDPTAAKDQRKIYSQVDCPVWRKTHWPNGQDRYELITELRTAIDCESGGNSRCKPKNPCNKPGDYPIYY